MLSVRQNKTRFEHFQSSIGWIQPPPSLLKALFLIGWVNYSGDVTSPHYKSYFFQFSF